ncbi:MAG: LytTR family DNA-binding domain-containing protein [Paludibacter sp.]|jgi:two-component system LytT family response regulator|nr:LytTR family DNA-binding domain-containing protein [Paludibacter sp.]
MNKIRTLIIDDEAPIRDLISGILENYSEKTEVCGTADGVKTGLEAIRHHNPELVLLDVNLTDGTGFDLLRQLDEIKFAVIFITAYEKYAVKAFRFSAVDYIMKPVNIDELLSAIDKAIGMMEGKTLNQQLKNFFDNLNSKPEDKKIVLKDSKSIYVIKVADIIRCEADHNYTTFYLTNNQQIVVSRTLKDYEELLSDFMFLRTHQSHLININHMLSFEKNDGGYLRMADGSNVPVSKRKRDELMAFFDNI